MIENFFPTHLPKQVAIGFTELERVGLDSYSVPGSYATTQKYVPHTLEFA